MKEYTVLTINPGSSSTKMGLVRGERVIFDKTIDHHKEDFAACQTYADQEPIRMKMIMEALKEEGIELSSLDAVSGRSVGLYPCTGGTYKIDELVYEHAKADVAGIRHPASLGIIISYKLGKQLGIPAFFVNPMPTDELCDEARVTGIPGIYRPAKSHPLNQKQVAIHHSELMGKKYEESNYVILHLGGGISITAHEKGRMIDGNRAGDGQGPISPNRSGDICIDDVMKCIKKGISPDEAKDYASKKGGLLAWCGTDDLREVKAMIANGDKKAELVYNAMVYSIGKWTAMMAGALKGKVDAILLTGGMAKDQELCEEISEYVSWIAPIYNYAGSFETEALGFGAVRVLNGTEEAKTYTGKPVWSGFEFDK
ncbi:MAG: butyrate kinase [Lachnospiraceae bacterium]|nr:butyrate kinase [Lachnospiraceae bacterium]